MPLRRAICAAVRRHRPEIVITNNFRETWGGQTLNQADHIATGKATLDAVRDAGNRWVFSEQIDAGLAALGRREAGLGGVAHRSPDTQSRPPRPSTAGSSRCGRTGPTSTAWAGHFDPEEFLEGAARPAGTRLGRAHGHPFEVFRGLG